MDKWSFVVDSLRSGATSKEAAEKSGYSLPMVYHIARTEGIQLSGNRKVDAGMRAAIEAAIKSGATQREIGERFGLSTTTVKQICHDAQLVFAGDYRGKDLEANAKAKIESASPEFEYIDGYDNWLSTVRIRCRKCGADRFVTYWGAAGKGVRCEACKAAANRHSCPICGKEVTLANAVYCGLACANKAARKRALMRKHESPEWQADQHAKEEKRKAREAERALKESRRVHPCVVCGAETARPKYCSEACARKASNKTREMRRRVRIEQALVDKDITLEGVWRNGLGVCYICGRVCDWNDKTEVDGTIICGETYPSIDHIIPLSRGGQHSWKNCALACRACNSRKSDHAPLGYPPSNFGAPGAKVGKHS